MCRILLEVYGRKQPLCVSFEDECVSAAPLRLFGTARAALAVGVACSSVSFARVWTFR
jgi:hypothetical protein